MIGKQVCEFIFHNNIFIGREPLGLHFQNSMFIVHRSESQVLRSLCKNKEGKEEVAVTHAKPEGALVVFTEDMEVPKMAKIHNYIAKVEICPAIYNLHIVNSDPICL